MTWCKCGRDWYNDFAYLNHMRTSPRHNWCEDCNIDFHSWIALKEHWVQSPRHDYCQYCDSHLNEDLYTHCVYEHSDAFCPPCNRVFKNAVGLHEHRRQSHSNIYCEACKRMFQHPNNLKNHLNSSTHRAKDIACPGHNCSARFVTQSALILHLEAGTCASGITRAIVNKAVREKDVHNIITDPTRLIGGPGGASPGDITYCATAAAWNGRAYECYLCHGTYKSLAGLNQHLASPRHQEKVYVCPLSACRERFNTLSGLCQHIESERCGVLRFGPVKRALDGFVNGMKTIRAY